MNQPEKNNLYKIFLLAWIWLNLIYFSRAVRCTIDKISDDGVYLLENGLYLFMYIGLAADPTWIQEVFGVQTAAQIDIDKTRLLDRETPASQRVRTVIGMLDYVANGGIIL